MEPEATSMSSDDVLVLVTAFVSYIISHILKKLATDLKVIPQKVEKRVRRLLPVISGVVAVALIAMYKASTVGDLSLVDIVKLGVFAAGGAIGTNELIRSTIQGKVETKGSYPKTDKK